MPSKSMAINCDCMDAMRQMPDKAFDLAICDPEYGRREDGGKRRSGFVRQKNGTKLYVSDGGYEKQHWDKRPAGPEYLKELFRVSKHQIIFGVNYFTDHTHFGSGRIVWDKCNDGTDQSDCEIAYNSLTNRVDIFRYMWRGMMQGKSITEGQIQQGNKRLNEVRIHPAQKPVNLYLWIMKTYAQPGWRLLDTHLGSGSSRIAAYELGLNFTGYEKDPEIFRAQEDRFAAYTAQTSLFAEATP